MHLASILCGFVQVLLASRLPFHLQYCALCTDNTEPHVRCHHVTAANWLSVRLVLLTIRIIRLVECITAFKDWSSHAILTACAENNSCVNSVAARSDPLANRPACIFNGVSEAGGMSYPPPPWPEVQCRRCWRLATESFSKLIRASGPTQLQLSDAIVHHH